MKEMYQTMERATVIFSCYLLLFHAFPPAVL